jgi:hypothetical protein
VKRTSPIILWVFPILLGIVAFVLRYYGGPFWYGHNTDPNYIYLLNSLDAALFHAPCHNDHPGTSVQFLGGSIIRILNPLSSSHQIAMEVLRHPERYLYLMSFTLTLLLVFSLFFAGRIIFNLTGNLIPALLLQVGPFVSGTCLSGVTDVRPEPLLLSLYFILSAVLIRLSTAAKEEFSNSHVLTLAFLLGIGMVTKITSLPLLLIPVILFPHWKTLCRFFSLLIATGFICLLPIFSRWSYIARWVYGMLTHVGRYGGGQRGLVDTHVYFSSLYQLLQDDWLFFLLVALSVAVLIAAHYFPGLLTVSQKRVLLAVSLTQLVQLLMVAKMPMSRYLIPALAIAGVNLVLLYQALLNTRLFHKIVSPIFLLIILCSLFFQDLREIIPFAKYYIKSREEADSINQVINEKYNDYAVAYYYGSSSPSSALKLGSDFGGYYFTKELDKLYPNSVFYDVWHLQFTTFSEILDPKHIIAEHPKLLFQGIPFEGFYKTKLPEQFKLQEIKKGDSEALYLATPNK